MKKRVIIILLVSTFVLSTNSFSSELENFVNDINTAWAAENYTNMLQIIDARLAVHTNDLAALLLKMNYHLAIDYNLSVAQSYIHVFTNTVESIDWSSDREAGVLCRVMILDVIDPVAAQNSGTLYNLNSNQLNQVHTESPDKNPLSDIISRIGLMQWGDTP